MGFYRFTRRKLSERPVQIGIFLLGVFLIYMGLRSNSVIIKLDGATFTSSDHTLTISRGEEEVYRAKLGINFDFGSSAKVCENMSASDKSTCIQWESGQRLKMSFNQDNRAKCYQIVWETLPDSTNAPLDCASIGRAHWYGGSSVYSDRWTAEKEPIKTQPYLTTDCIGDINDHDSWGPVMERYWLSSKGVALFVEDYVPLHVGINRKQLCFKSQYTNSPYESVHHPGLLPVLDYKICVGENVKAIHQYMAFHHWDRPQGIPDERMLKYPIWSTWARYKAAIDQKKTLGFAKEITQHGFLGCQIEIDDMYTPTYGDFVFDKQKFPDPKGLRKSLRNLGFKTTSWIIPFHNLDSEAFANGVEYEYFIRSDQRDVPSLTNWWQGNGAILDVTNPSAVKWFGKRLQRLRDEGVDSFKFDAGETSWLPKGLRYMNPLPHPNHFTKIYAQTMYDLSDNMIEVRSAYKNQNLPIFIRMLDKFSRWDYKMGLKTLIPTALTFGIIGYPFILPDMVGGNAYGEDNSITDTILPEKELFIRWAQVTAFMPSIQFSICPWDFDGETVEITKQLMKLREEYIFPKILKLARHAVATGDPIIRPLWWLDPEDSTTYDIDSQFLVGDDLLVAPILEKGAIARKIYFPSGKWRDMLEQKKNIIHEGNTWLFDYEVKLNQVAYFERVL